MFDEESRIRGRAPDADSEELVLQVRDALRAGEELLASKILVQEMNGDVRRGILNRLLNDEGQEKRIEKLSSIYNQDAQARATLDYYELVQEGDVAPPSAEQAFGALERHFEAFPQALEEVKGMIKPTLQYIPVYDREAAGTRRMVGAFNAKPREGQEITHISHVGMNVSGPVRIEKWQVAVVEGAKELPEESNRFLLSNEGNKRIQRLEEQLTQWQQYCRKRGLKLCGRDSYMLLQMQELRLADPEEPLETLGLDVETVTYLGDRLSQRNSDLMGGRWDEDLVYFHAVDMNKQRPEARFRSSVVVDVS